MEMLGYLEVQQLSWASWCKNTVLVTSNLQSIKAVPSFHIFSCKPNCMNFQWGIFFGATEKVLHQPQWRCIFVCLPQFTQVIMIPLIGFVQQLREYEPIYKANWSVSTNGQCSSREQSTWKRKRDSIENDDAMDEWINSRENDENFSYAAKLFPLVAVPQWNKTSHFSQTLHPQFIRNVKLETTFLVSKTPPKEAARKRRGW